ncbi:ATP-binding protein [Aquabacterium sp.]|uniref:sensor histidine kinase n=1 Tax=Aquabacterium sp. TaxID=1872578 RepID=UPI002487701F|nr:ATP-binding protein [Aquabacterium sp.]MDI1350380.1 ATP-binding protein [Aquabacterium sp.]
MRAQAPAPSATSASTPVPAPVAASLLGMAPKQVWVLLGLALAAVVAVGLLALNQEASRLSRPDAHMASDGDVHALRQAWAVPDNGAHFPAPAIAQVAGKPVNLPDEWSRSQPGYKGGVWYRFPLTFADGAPADTLLAALIDRACSSVEVQLNGAVVFRSGRMVEPYARDCFGSHVVPLPAALLRPTGNVLDVKVAGYPIHRVTARQRAGGLAAVHVGPMSEVRQMADEQTLWTTTLSQIMGGVLVVMGVFSLGLAWVRRLHYMLYFGLLTLGWALMTGRFWRADLPVPNDAMEVLIAIMMAPMTAFAVKFLMGYAGIGLRDPGQQVWNQRVNLLLWAQCLLLPLSLLLLGVDQLFLGARVWFGVFTLELFLAIGHFLWVTGRGRRAEFWLMCAALGVVAAVLGIELSYQSGLLQSGGLHITHFVMPLLYAAVGVRLIQVYARALQSAEGARAHLERRVQEISVEIERNFNQIAELRVDQIAEKERKRIAGDLHDDLGAKLLTIVHTSDNDRISTLAREALEEMRLSVRGLTGRPMVLSDSMADWRSEVVSRLGQAGIECEWRNPHDTIEEPLSSRTYVQTTRIVREAVSNIIKHSGASHVVITADVDLANHVFTLVIQDNGKGIPMELDGRLDRGHGMTSMKHRAKQLNGQCLVESGPGFGTVIRLTLPLEIATMQQVLSHRLGS